MLDRTQAPAFQIPAHTSLQPVTSIALSNGVMYHELVLGSQEVCRIEIVMRSGVWYEANNGTAYFTGKMLLEGTLRLSARQIADKLDYYGAYWEITPGLDFTTITIYTLSKHLEEVVPFFVEAVMQAAFPQKELDTQKKIKTQQIRVNRQKTAALAAHGLRNLLFGAHHPYGKELLEEDVEAIDVSLLQRHHKENLFNKAEIFVSGLFSEAQSVQLQRLFGGLPVVSQPPKAFAVPATPFVREIVPLEGSVQASLRLGRLTVDRHHPDHVNLMLLNELFGGYFGSRLMKNIREEKGYTYGIYSSISYLQHEAFWQIGADVNREVAIAAVEEILKEMRVLCNEPVPPAELETVKNYMAGTFLTSISSPFAVMDKFKSVHFAGLDYGYYDRLLSGIRQSTTRDLLRVANDFFDEEKWLQVIGGGI